MRSAAIALHLPLVRRLACSVHRRLPASVELDDLVQAGLIGLNDALQRFDCTRGSAFEAFAVPRIRGAMFDELRRWSGRSLTRPSGFVSLDDEDSGLGELIDPAPGPAAAVVDRLRLEAVTAAMGALPDRERYVMLMVYEHGLTLDEIGLTLGVSGSRVCQIVQRAIARLQVRLRAWA